MTPPKQLHSSQGQEHFDSSDSKSIRKGVHSQKLGLPSNSAMGEKDLAGK